MPRRYDLFIHIVGMVLTSIFTSQSFDLEVATKTWELVAGLYGDTLFKDLDLLAFDLASAY